jgi:UDP:flavonoid glycosyltransferase YjiC (YdhE family)
MKFGARIAHHKTGVVTSVDKLSADGLASIINEVLTNPIYRQNSRNLQKAIAQADGLAVAVDLIEESLLAHAAERKMVFSRATMC